MQKYCIQWNAFKNIQWNFAPNRCISAADTSFEYLTLAMQMLVYDISHVYFMNAAKCMSSVLHGVNESLLLYLASHDSAANISVSHQSCTSLSKIRVSL